MKLKPIIAFILAIIIVSAGSRSSFPVALAQSSELQMNVTTAYSGYFKYGEWLPIWIELQNQGQDINGQVRVEVSNSSGLTVFATPVSLPSGSHKLFPVYVLPNNFSRELQVKLVVDGKTLTSRKATVRPQANISFFVGILAPERGALSILSGVKLPGQERPKILVDLTLAELPDRSEALNSFDLLILNDIDTSKLNSDQASALAGWVQRGGHLVIGGGAGAQRTLSGLPETLRPFNVQGSGDLNTQEIAPLAEYAKADAFLVTGPFVSASGEVATGSKISAGDTSLPLLVERNVSNGLAQFITLDLTTIPFNGWSGTQHFWETIIGPGGEYPQNMPFDTSMRQYRANSLYYALSNIPSLDLPSIKGIMILLGFYILIVGPLNYLILRWRRQLHLAWVTIPVITALFTAGAFGIGYTMRGNDLVLNKIALVDVGADGNAGVISYMGLFSPRQTNYEVTVEGEGLLSPMGGYDANPWGGGPNLTGGEMVFVQGTPSQVNGLTVNQWSMQSFMSEGNWANFGQFSADLRLSNDTMVGKVRNNTSYTLKDAAVIVQSRFSRLGDLAPGEEKEVNIGLSNLQNDRFNSPLSYRLYQENYANGGQIPREIELKTNILSSLLDNTYWMKTASANIGAGGNTSLLSGAVLLGWLDQAPPDVKIAGNRLSYQTTALVYTSLDYSYPTSGYIQLPPGMVPGVISKMPTEGGMCGYATSVSIGRGQAEFDFEVPDSLANANITTLKLALWLDSGMQWGVPDIALYHWADQNWTSIKDPIQGTNVIQNAAPYVKDSTVRVRVSTESNNFGCIYVDMGLEAEKPSGSGGQP